MLIADGNGGFVNIIPTENISTQSMQIINISPTPTPVPKKTNNWSLYFILLLALMLVIILVKKFFNKKT